MGRKLQFLKGMKAGIPVVMGFIPVGIAYAAMAQQAGFLFGETILMSAVVFAGASQMMAAGMYAQGAGMAAIIFATFIINLRHLIMSTCVFKKLGANRNVQTFLAAFGVTDESFAIITTGQEEGNLYFFLGLVLATYLSWIVGSFLGAVAAALLPPVLSASLGIALYAMFIGLLVPNIKHNSRLGLLVLATGVVNTLLSSLLSASWAMILSTLACAAAGVFFVDLEQGEAK